MKTNCVLSQKNISETGQYWKYLKFRQMIILSVATLIFPCYLSAQTPADHTHNENDLVEQSEDFWSSIDFIKFKRDIARELKISSAEMDLFYDYLEPMIHEDRVYFFSNAPFGGILPSEYESYLSKIKQKYISEFPSFALVKEQFALEQAALNNQPLVVNGPCTNIGFESGNYSGWRTQTGTACDNGNCTLNNNNNPGCRIRVTDNTMTDPWIPGLSPVCPTGGSNSIRLGDFQNGRGMSRISQTFMVTNNNNIFTYKYAVVLEDPTNNHSDDQRPYFEVMMYDEDGDEIECATYTRIASANYLADYINNPVPNPGNSSMNGCGYGGNTPNNADNTRNLWYKDWTTVSIPLLNYVGQNVTVVFTSSDCSRGAHIGYAYVDAECSSMTPLNPVTICGIQDVTYTASPGFASYEWTGPGIVSGTNSQTVTLNTPGTYSLTLTPISDNPLNCPTTQTITIPEHCIPPPLTITLCEEVKGSGTVTGINLNDYVTQLLNYNITSPKSLVSWHTALPPTTANRISNPTNLTVSNGRRYYGVINYTANPGSDTTQIQFIINPKPNINFPVIPSFCEGSSATQISGVTPAGGTFSGSNVTAGGVFNPSTAGSHTIKYTFTNSNGCIDSVSRVALVKAPPAVNAGGDYTICSNTPSISITGASVTNSAGSQWIGGTGSFSPNRNSLTATYTPSSAEISSGSVSLTLSTAGNSPCTEVTDGLQINIVPMPAINAGPDQSVCTTSPAVTLSASATNAPGVSWSGGTAAGFSTTTSGNSIYTPSATEISAGTVTLTFSTTGVTTCRNISDQLVITIVPAPTVDAGTGQNLCADVTSVSLSGSAANFSSRAWTGGAGTFSPNASAPDAAYVPTTSEKASGSVTLTFTSFANSPCANVSDNVTISFVQPPVVNAGTDKVACSSGNPVFAMDAASTNGGGLWSGGGGNFSSASDPNAVYTPSAAELLSGGIITLSYTSTGSPLCPTVSDVVTVSLVLPPQVDAGTVPAFCSTVGIIALNGTASNTSGINWSGGSGPFIPNSSRTNPNYIPTPAEKASGSLTLTFTALANAPCTNVTDNVTISFAQPPTVNAGPDQTLCASGSPVFVLAGTSTNGGGVWSGGGGNFSDVNAANATYTPSGAEIAAGGTITLTYTSAGSPLCPVDDDAVNVSLVLPPTAAGDPGPTHCADVTTVSLSGSATNYTSIIWSGGAGTFAAHADPQSTDYTPDAAEKTFGSVTLNFTAVANAPCANATDNITVSFVQPPAIHAGPDQTLCASGSPVFTLSGTSANGGGVWSGGGGNFSDVNDANSTYTPSAAEMTSGGAITLTYTSEGSPLCPIVNDEVDVSLVLPPTAVADPGPTHCADITTVTLSGSATNFSSIVWSGGLGTFSPHTDPQSADYTPDAAEKTSGSVTVNFTAVANAPCANVTDNISISFIQPPTINAGMDQVKCDESGLTFTLNGSFTNAPAVLWSGGSGNFSDATDMAAVYTPSDFDRNAGTIVLSFVTTGNTHCPEVSDDMSLTIGPIPVPYAGPDQTVCMGSSVTLSTQNIHPETYVWTDLSGTVLANDPSLSLTVNTDTTLIVTATSSLSCINRDTLFIDAVPMPLVSVPDDAMCPGQSVVLNGSVANLSDIAAYNPVYTWSRDGVPVAGNGNTLTTGEGGVYTLQVAVHGTCSGNDQALVTLHPSPLLNMPETIKFCEDNQPYVVLDAGAANSYSWSPGNETTQTIQVSSPGTYYVTITNQYSCSASDKTLVRRVCPPRLFLGNAFSPDKDGINDLYNVYGVHIGKYHMLIFNRWGEIIFESHDRTHFWDGIYRDEPMPIGVYPWRITYEGDTEEFKGPYKLEGSVTIVR